MEKIKYQRIGSDFTNAYMIQMSTSTPPNPFYDTDSGDEWEQGSDGATVIGRFIKLYIDYMKENPVEYIASDTWERSFQLLAFGMNMKRNMRNWKRMEQIGKILRKNGGLLRKLSCV